MTIEIDINAHFTDSLCYTIELPEERTITDIKDVDCSGGTLTVLFKDGESLSTDNYTWVEPDYGEADSFTILKVNKDGTDEEIML